MNEAHPEKVLGGASSVVTPRHHFQISEAFTRASNQVSRRFQQLRDRLIGKDNPLKNTALSASHVPTLVNPSQPLTVGMKILTVTIGAVISPPYVKAKNEAILLKLNLILKRINVADNPRIESEQLANLLMLTAVSHRT